MAKRYSDSKKYRKPFYRNLPMEYKMLWDFLCLDCDHAGIWDVDFQMAQMCLGVEKFTSDEVLKILNKDEQKIVVLEENVKWFIPSFIPFQYKGMLSPKNRVHKSALDILKKEGINPETLKVEIGQAQADPSTKPSIETNTNVKSYNELPAESYLDVKEIGRVYVQDERLLGAISKTSKKTEADIVAHIPTFVDHLISQGRAMETPSQFASYFKNWLKFQEVPEINKPKKIDWSLLSNEEMYTLSDSEQLELIRTRTIV